MSYVVSWKTSETQNCSTPDFRIQNEAKGSMLSVVWQNRLTLPNNVIDILSMESPTAQRATAVERFMGVNRSPNRTAMLFNGNVKGGNEILLLMCI